MKTFMGEESKASLGNLFQCGKEQEQPVPLCKELLPDIKTKPILFQCEPIAPFPVTICPYKSLLPSFL